MSWLFSQALVEEYLGAGCLDGEPYAPLNTTPTPEAFYWPDKTTEHSRLSRFGMMYEPLMGDHGEALLMWFLEGFHVKTYQSQEKAMDLMGSVPVFGQKWLGSLAKCDHDTRSWKTHQFSLVEDSGAYLETWPRWGSMQNGESWERTTPELPTCGTEFGLWPTPCATDNSDRKPSATMHETKRGTFKHKAESGVLSQVRLSQVVRHKSPPSDGRLNPEWVEWLMGWPIGQTGLKPLEMDKFQEWLQQHGNSSEAHK